MEQVVLVLRSEVQSLAERLAHAERLGKEEYAEELRQALDDAENDLFIAQHQPVYERQPKVSSYDFA